MSRSLAALPFKSATLLALAAVFAACPRRQPGPAPDGAGTDPGAADAGAADAGPTGDREARPSNGCALPSGLYPAGQTRGQIAAGGQTRTFLVHLPARIDRRQPAPLVLLFHGGGGTGAQLEGSARFTPVADREGVVAVYPDGLSRTWNAGRCCGPSAEQGVDDVGFVAALFDHLEQELCLDRRRLYATGMSNGAMLSHRLACALSDRVAAVAPVAGTDMTTACTPRRPVAVLQIHGTEDRHVPWAGGAGCGLDGPFTSVPATTAAWLGRNGCAAGAPLLIAEQGEGRCEVQGRCAAGAEVVLCTIAGAGHSWPGGEPKGAGLLPACVRAGDGPQAAGFIASEQIWRFFAGIRAP